MFTNKCQNIARRKIMAHSRAAATTEITFGLVRIPVKLYLTAAPEKASFSLLTQDGHRVNQKWIDAETKEEVEYESLLRAVKTGKDEFVSFTKEEIKELAEEKSGIELVSLVPNGRISLTGDCVEKSYFLTPDKSDKAYKMFHACLTELGKVAIAKFYTTNGKDNLVAIEARSRGVLFLHQLYFEPELRDTTVVFARGSDPDEKEVRLGIQLLRTYAERTFVIGEHKDEYGARVAMAVERKLAGERVSGAKKEIAGVAIDLASLLEDSLKKEKQ
jgi:DNA end-binding protein Ku